MKWHKGPECILASGKPGSDGYGKKKVNGKTVRAHRLAYCEANGIELSAIAGYVVMHSCDVPMCINPAHLSLGSALDNARDMVNKGRQAKSERSGRSKLTNEQVHYIREHYRKSSRNASARVFAERFGVSRRTICAVVIEHTWKGV